MARIPRKFQKIFAGSASNNGVFGSAADNTKILSNDLDVIQGLPAYDAGWIDAVIGTKKFPALEEFQALHYMTTTQLSYLFQQGIAEWNADTTYYQNSIVCQTGTYILYGSLTDDNIGNALSDPLNWVELIDLSTSSTVPFATESVRGIAKIATAAEVLAGTDDETIVTPLKLAAYKLPTGMVSAYALTTAPTGWVLCSNLTIGNASSGATNRANADTAALFTALWNTYDNTLLPIQNSSGAATSRGVDAATDYAANKRLPTLDLRGRVVAGLDNMGGTPAGRLSGQPQGVNGLVAGNSGGLESCSLTGAQNGPHTHGGNYNPAVNTGGPAVLAFNLGCNYDRDTASSGSGTPHNNVQPTIILPYIIKL